MSMRDASAEPPPEPAFDCSAVAHGPVAFETLEGFTSSEDFVFDAQGNYVGMDESSNLIRISKTGQKQLWAPALSSGVAGMAILPDDSLIFCDVAAGALKRVYPNGAVSVVLGGLLYPNGLDIGPDGFVYVAENAGGRVRRVNPQTGEFSVVALGLTGPNGIAFSDDPSLLYVGSFEGSGVYKLELSTPGELGHASVFARMPGATLKEPELACAGGEEGADCQSASYIAGKCQALANVVDCLPVDPCPGLTEGDICDYPGPGTCQAGRCVPPCDGLAEGAACEDPTFLAGVCVSEFYGMFCVPRNPCEGAAPGAACVDSFGPGSCQGEGEDLFCVPLDPCEGRGAGDACEDAFIGGTGVCEAFDETLSCVPPNVCEGLTAGAVCLDPQGEGTCVTLDGGLYCWLRNVCDSLTKGAPCSEPGFVGVCTEYQGYPYCGPPSVCESLTEGAPCFDESGSEGVCTESESGLYCASSNVCIGLSTGVPCSSDTVGIGVCTDQRGTLYCASVACNGLTDGDACNDARFGSGVCSGGVCDSSPGGVDGMAVDACGNVYATEFVKGNVWRISPAGESALLATLPSGWIPNMKWGRDVGGFSSQVMYVADRDQGRLFGISLGARGATEFYEGRP